MPDTAQIALLPALQVARANAAERSPNGVRWASFGETRLTRDELERIVQSVPAAMASALESKAYYFVPLTIGEHNLSVAPEDTLIAPDFSVELSDRAICHRNVAIDNGECVFISTRLMQDRFALSFEFFINIGRNFVDVAGVPEGFSQLAWSQAVADIRGETSQDAWENRRQAMGLSLRGDDSAPPGRVDEKAKSAFLEAAFADTLAIYLLSLTVDFDYHELREREYPLLAPAALAERLRHVAQLFPPNRGYEFAVLYRRKA
jgi:hypothetical protein